MVTSTDSVASAASPSEATPREGAQTTRRFAEVAVDAAGIPGGRTFSYHLPAWLEDLVVGEAVLVSYGHRRAVGVVLGLGGVSPERDTKPVIARIHVEQPLLPELQARLARHIADHYLAPPAMVVRAMLPVGLLERVKLIVSATASAGAQVADDGLSADPVTSALLTIIRAAGPLGVAVDDLPLQGSRRSRARLLRDLASAGVIASSWRLGLPDARPRLERVVRITVEGHRLSQRLTNDPQAKGVSGRALGARQRALLLELALANGDALPAPPLAASYGAGALTSLARRGLLEIDTVARRRRPLGTGGAAERGLTARGSRPEGARLTDDQAAVIKRVERLAAQGEHAGLVLAGATASGKTAVYAEAIAMVLALGRGAIVLVPEIALAVPLVDRLRHDLAIEPALIHSGLSDGERADEWRRIRNGQARVVVGTRSAILAPLVEPGLLIVDEEHDAAYKADRTPRYQARDVALHLGRLAGIPVILGSATPDMVSLGRAALGTLELHRLADRPGGAGASIELVDLRAELAAGNRGSLSLALVEALTGLDTRVGERAILVIDRRGSASVVLCRDCGYVQICPECQRPLVFHATAMALRCHHCGATAPIARRCPACASPRIRYLGGGTERVEREVRIRSPHLRVARIDRDVIERKGAAVAVIDDFIDGRTDVLVGTRVVAKGLDVPEVTLVAVVSADIALHLPDDRAAERTYQLLTQAAGRAGRGARRGRVIIQTYQPDHRAIRAVVDGDAASFLAAELADRRAFRAPPFGQLIKLTVALTDRAAAERTANGFAGELRSRAERLSDGGAERCAVLGPVPAYIARRAGRWRFHLVLRGPDPRAVLGHDPGPPWSVDVDPDSLL